MRTHLKLAAAAVFALLLVNVHLAHAESPAQAQGSKLMEAMMQMSTQMLGGPYQSDRGNPLGYPMINPAVAMNPVTMWGRPMMTMSNPYVFMNPMMSMAMVNPYMYMQYMNPMAYAPWMTQMMNSTAYTNMMGRMMDPQAYANWYQQMQASVVKPEQYKALFDTMQQSLAGAAPASPEQN